MKTFLVLSAVLIGTISADYPKPVTYESVPEPYEPTHAPYKPSPPYHHLGHYPPAPVNKPHCPGNETYEYCVPCRYQHCNDMFMFCHMKCNDYVAGCYCSKGYVRDDDGNCVLPNDCCDEDAYEQFYKCKPCRTDCFGKFSMECLLCLERGCYCKPGYLRDEYNRCVPSYQCSSGSSVY